MFHLKMQSGKGKTGFYAIFLTFQPSSIKLRQHFSHKFYGRTCMYPLDVRPYTLRTYVHTPFERTCIHPRTYVQRKDHLRKRDICPEIVIFQACENRIFAHGGILG